mmetsp:Transcript_18199/g.43072  ORF Transcript_18199/g.43072 Transcript_18199/m.43072 type:complete len:352 (-) Transcript_18199:307-1362(-)
MHCLEASKSSVSANIRVRSSFHIILELIAKAVVVHAVHAHHLVLAHVFGHVGLLLLPLNLLDVVEHLLLPVLLLEEGLLGELLRLLEAVGHKDVVEDGAGLDLPQLEADVGAAVSGAHGVHLVVVGVFRVGDHGMLPRSLVVRIVDHLGLPRPLEVRIVDHGRLPFAVVLVVPVVGLLGIGVGNFLRDVVVSIGLLVVRVGNSLLVHPVVGLGLVRVLDLLGGEEVELVLELAIAHGLVVDEDLEGVVGPDDEGVQVGELVVLDLDLVLHEEVVVLLVVVEDGVGLLVGRAADVGTEHDGVGGIASELLGGELLAAGQELDVRAAAVDLLLVLDGELEDEVLARRRLEGLG